MACLLHAHSWFSHLCGASSPDALAIRAARCGFTALALTDRHSVSGAVQHLEACKRGNLKPLFGAELKIDGCWLVVIARNTQGYSAVCDLITTAHARDRLQPSLQLGELHNRKGLVCLTGGEGGRLRISVRRNDIPSARLWLRELYDVFGDNLFVELTHHMRPDDRLINERLCRLATDERIPVIAGGDTFHAGPHNYFLHDLLSCIRLGITVYDRHPERPINDAAHIMEAQDFTRLLPFPEAHRNAERLAAECTVELLPGRVLPPPARRPSGMNARHALRTRCYRELKLRYRKQYKQAAKRLETELAVIEDLELVDYFLITGEIIDEARKRGISYSGRGSAANSLAAHLLGVTHFDPLAYRTVFERFLHAGKMSSPDIDIDFQSDRRDEIIEWMEQRFGHGHTAMAATYVTYGLRSALRESAKALGWPLPLIDRLTKAVPAGRADSVEHHAEAIREVLGDAPLTDTLLRCVQQLHGCPRHLSLHVGGMVLTRPPIRRISPVQPSANGVYHVQFDKNDIEKLGGIKVDILGLRMLSTIAMAQQLIRRWQVPDFDIEHIPPDDPRTMNLLRSSRTVGLFQVESPGQMALLGQLQPESMADLIAQVALFRPGPIQSGVVHPYVRRRRGQEPVTYDHPALEPILRDTLGIILFQEQVLEITRVIAGMSLPEGNRFRAILSLERSAEETHMLEARFVAHAVANGIAQETAETIFAKLNYYTGYGFCRSHAIAFARIVYQSAYLKSRHPAAYMAAFLEHRPGFYPQQTLEEETKRLGVRILPVDINASGMAYDLEARHGRPVIRKPFTAVKHVSEATARTLVLERMYAPYTSVANLVSRSSIERKALDALAQAGALDSIGGGRRDALWRVGIAANAHARHGGQPELFEMDADDIPTLPPLDAQESIEWDFRTQSAAPVHPMALHRRTMQLLEVRPISTVYAFDYRRDRRQEAPKMTISGIVILRQRPSTANGVLFVTLEDESGYIQVVMRPEFQETYRFIFTAALIVYGSVAIAGNWRGMTALKAWPLDSAIGGYTGFPNAQGGHDALLIGTRKDAPPAAVTS